VSKDSEQKGLNLPMFHFSMRPVFYPPLTRKQPTRKQLSLKQLPQQNKSITTLCDVKKGQENLSLLFLSGYGLFSPFLLNIL
jgi:hypothetical protein